MDPNSITKYITDTFDGIGTVSASGDTFFFYDPVSDLPPDRRFPFATLVTGDNHDQASNLSRPTVFRLNIGVKRDTYRALFGPPPSGPITGAVVDTGHDFTALDQILPHPIYASLSWVCVLNPSSTTFEAARALLAEAYALAVDRSARRHARE